MADDKKRRKRTKGTSGRATSPASGVRTTVKSKETDSPRYTPPVPMKFKQGSRVAPILMFTFFGLGVAIILLNYLPGAPLVGTVGGWMGFPTDTSNGYLLVGLLFICLGFGAATKYQ